MDGKTIQLLAAILGLAGGVILAFSLNRVLSEVLLAVNALSTSIESVATKGDVYVFRGLDERLNNANTTSNSWVRAGIYCLTAPAVISAFGICFA